MITCFNMSHVKIDLIKDYFSEQRPFIEGEVILTLSGVIHFSSIGVDLVLLLKVEGIHVVKRLARIELLNSVAEFRPGLSRFCFKLTLERLIELPPIIAYPDFEINYEIRVEAITDSPLAFSLKEKQPVKFIKEIGLESRRLMIPKDMRNTNPILCCSKGVNVNFQVEALYSSHDGLNIKISTCESVLHTPYVALKYRLYGDLCYAGRVINTFLIWEDSKALLANFLTFEMFIHLDMFPFDYVVDGTHIKYVIRLEIQYFSRNICVNDLKEIVYLHLDQ